jgi:hypothetical protein
MEYGESTVTAMLRVLARATEDPGALVLVRTRNPAQRARLSVWLRAVHGTSRRVEQAGPARVATTVVQVRLPARMWWPAPALAIHDTRAEPLAPAAPRRQLSP